YFMIAANTAVAQFLERHRYASVRRVLRAPERWGRIVELARACGASLPATPDARALSDFLAGRERAAPERFPDLSLSIVKLLGSAEHVRKRPGEAVQGHFGLAVDDYTHATAPNRRFPDLGTQRLVKAALAGRPSPCGSCAPTSSAATSTSCASADRTRADRAFPSLACSHQATVPTSATPITDSLPRRTSDV